MEEIYGFHSTSSDYTTLPENNLILPAEYGGLLSYSVDNYRPFYGSEDLLSATASVITEAVSIATTPDQVLRPRRRSNRQRDQAKNDDGDEYGDDDVCGEIIKAKIASHPKYSKLLDAYIDCQKVGAPPEIACLLEEIHLRKQNAVSSTCLGADPELDEFMETYCDVLVKYKSDLARPFDEANVFLNNIETQLSNLCKDEGGTISSEEEFSGGETSDNTKEDQELKDTLMRKYGGHISSLKQELFSKKKKKGKLPNEARQTLLEWWNSHYKWPYPTEADKIILAETTGLDQKQINNWFINQRKRHWKPSENMQLAVMGSLSGQYFYDD